MQPRFKQAGPSRRTVLDYEHPDTRAYIRAALQRLSDDGHIPHRDDWAQWRPPCLPTQIHHIREALGFASIEDVAAWAGLEKAKRAGNANMRGEISKAEQRQTDERVGAWVEEQKRRIAQDEYGYGLKVACERTVNAWNPRVCEWQPVSVLMLR